MILARERGQKMQRYKTVMCKNWQVRCRGDFITIPELDPCHNIWRDGHC